MIAGTVFARSTLAVAALLVLAASPARADWVRVESERFIIYSDGRESDALAYSRTLESFDRLLRLNMGMDLDEAPIRKLPIYTVGSRRDLERIVPDIGDHVAGVYLPVGEDIFAVAIRDQGDSFVLLHEYAHHFMMQNFSYGYPAWFVEGFAEYYMTASIRGDRVELGRFHENRGYWLREGRWLPLDDLLSSRPGEVRRNSQTYYPLAWLLTHWFMASDERRPQLHAYLLDIGQGGDPVEAMERATGLSIEDLRREMRSYMRSGIPYIGFDYAFPDVETTVTRLPDSANDLLLLNQRVKVGVAAERREDTVAEIRRRAARHPDDPFARLALGHAELHMGDAARGEAILLDLLANEPEHVEALQLMASARMAQAAENPDNADSLMRQARGYLQRAYNVDNEDYYTLFLIARSRMGAEGYPNDNDLLTWRLAYHTAPQWPSSRLGLAEALLERGDAETAIIVLQPLANSPHGGDGATYAQALIERAMQGNPADPEAEASGETDATPVTETEADL